MHEFRVAANHYYHRPLTFAPDGRHLFVEARPFAQIDTTDGTVRGLPDVVNLSDQWFALSRGGRAVVFSNGALFAHDITTGERLFRPPGAGHARAFASGPRADTLFVSDFDSDSGTSTLKALADDLSDRAELLVVPDRIERLAISADGNWLAGRSQTGARVWSIGGPARETMSAPWKGPTFAFALSGDGARLAVATNRSLALWNTATGEEVFRNGRDGAKLRVVACHPGQAVVAAGGDAGAVLFWDHTGRVLTQFDWGLRGVRGLTFSPDGLRCAAADADGRVVVWDVDL